MIDHPARGKPLAAVALVCLLALMGTDGRSQTVAGPSTEPQEAIDWRWAVSQGGLTIVVLVLVWSYRKDSERWAQERIDLRSSVMEEKIAFQQAKIDEALRYNRHLEQVMGRADAALKATSDAVMAHTVAVTRMTDSTQMLASVIGKLDSRMEQIERQA